MVIKLVNTSTKILTLQSVVIFTVVTVSPTKIIGDHGLCTACKSRFMIQNPSFHISREQIIVNSRLTKILFNTLYDIMCIFKQGHTCGEVLEKFL